MLCLFVFNIYANSNNNFDDNNNTISEIKLYKGWNLVSIQENDFTKYDNLMISVWGYKDNKWHAYSNNNVIYSKIVNLGIPQLKGTNSSDGIWILSQKDANITVKNQSVKNYNIKKGWNLLGTDKKIETSIFDNSCVSYLWKYNNINKKWQLYRSDGIDKYFGYDKFTKIEANSGFWAYANNSCKINICDDNSTTIEQNQTQSQEQNQTIQTQDQNKVQNQTLSTTPPIVKKKLLVPLYSYPNDDVDGAWHKLITLKHKYPSINIVAIVNQSNGNFTEAENSYINGIEELNNAGIKVIGYVYTKYGKRPIKDVETNIDAWVKFYKSYGLKGFFFDESSTKKKDFPYYKKISDYAKSNGCKMIVLNPGAVVDKIYMSSGIASVIVIRETTYDDLIKNNTDLYNKPTATTKLGLIIYSATENNIVADIYNFATKHQFDYIYSTDHGLNDDRYNKLSSYLDALLSNDINGTSNNRYNDHKRTTEDQIVSIFEYDTPTFQYGAAENISDGRGITAGRIGFTSSSSMLEVIKRYTDAVPNNSLATYIPRLKELSSDGNGSTVGLEGLETAWKANANNQKFRDAQDAVVTDMYYTPAVEHAKKLGAKLPLTVLNIYDALIQQGDGDDPDGLQAMIDKTTADVNGTMKNGIDEKRWLLEFMKVRRYTLEHPHTKATKKGWAESTKRVDTLLELYNNDEFHLELPITVNPYGDAHVLR